MKKRIYVQTYGGLGDVALLTPIFKELKLQFPDFGIIALCATRGHYEVLKRNPHIDVSRILTPVSRTFYELLHILGIKKINRVKYAALRPSFSYTLKASEIIAEMVGIKLTDNHVQIYLDEKEDMYAKRLLAEYTNPVVIQITSAATQNQMWPIEKWNELVARMRDHTFIQVGLPHETKVDGVVDFRGKTSIRESMALVKHASFFVGVVSFLSHVTNAFGTRGVVFFGPSSLAVWGHSNNINISKKLPCSNCIDWLRFKECPYDKPCMKLISVREVQDALLRQSAQMINGSKQINDISIRQSETII